MITTTQVFQCRKCQSENIIKNGHNRSGNPQYLCKSCGARRVLTPTIRYTAEQQSELAQNALKNPYVFDFLSLGKDAHEREIEKGLVAHIEKFLLELGEGFAFLDRQYHLQIEGQDFYIDLLFYHIKLRCFVVIELKTGDFKPEYAGKMNFW